MTAGFDIPPSFQAVTAEYIQDISGEMEEQFYLTTQDMYRLHRYTHTVYSYSLHVYRYVSHNIQVVYLGVQPW